MLFHWLIWTDIYLVSDNVERLKEAVLALKDDLEKLNLKVNFNKCRTTRQVPGLEEIAVDKNSKYWEFL